MKIKRKASIQYKFSVDEQKLADKKKERLISEGYVLDLDLKATRSKRGKIRVKEQSSFIIKYKKAK